MHKLAILFICLCFLIKTGIALTCYNCQSSDANDCTDLKTVQTLECEPSKRDQFPPVCIRKVLKGNCAVNITMQCTDKQTGNECEPPSSNYTVTACKICRENLCNASNNFITQIGLISLLSLTLISYYFN